MKVLDIDRDRQRISLGLKQTQEDPWQRVVDTYNVGDELEGKVTKVVTFGAFVEILDGVEGLVHISELAQHHVENPREIIQPGDEVKVKILEIDSERRRLSLSIKRVEGQVLPLRADRAGGRRRGRRASYDDVPELGLSEDVFAGDGAPAPRSRPPRPRRPSPSRRPRLRRSPRSRLSPRRRRRPRSADEARRRGRGGRRGAAAPGARSRPPRPPRPSRSPSEARGRGRRRGARGRRGPDAAGLIV